MTKRWLESVLPRKRSVAFVSLHKCATDLFARTVLPAARGLEHVDYQELDYRGELDGHRDAVRIRPRGHLYGPLRVLDDDHPTAPCTNPLLDPTVLARTRVVVLVRDPRDILVSEYHSFGFSHGLSPNPEIRAYQTRRREQIQAMTIDRYATTRAPVLARKLEVLRRLERGRGALLLRYEEMIHDFEAFFRRLRSALDLPDAIRRTMSDSTRPEPTERPLEHKRSGRTGSHRSRLTPATVAEIDSALGDALRAFGYRESSSGPVATDST